MRTTLTVPAKDRESAVVQAALIIEDRSKRGDCQRITGEPVKIKGSAFGGIKSLPLWRVPVADVAERTPSGEWVCGLCGDIRRHMR